LRTDEKSVNVCHHTVAWQRVNQVRSASTRKEYDMKLLPMRIVGCLLVSCGTAGLAAAQAGSGLPDPSRTGSCDNPSMPTSPGQNSPGKQHRNGDPDWRDVCACTTTCSDGAWSSDGDGGVDPAWLNPDVIVHEPPPPRPDPGPPIMCSFADGDVSPACGSLNIDFAPNYRSFDPVDGGAPGYQGWGWFQHSRPELVVDDEDEPGRVRIFVGSNRVLDFTLVESSSPNVFVGVNGVNGIVARESGNEGVPELYHYYDTHGNCWTFFGYSTDNGEEDAHGANGQLWTAVAGDGSGAAMYTGHPTDPSAALTSGFELDSSLPTARASVVYDGAGRRMTYAYTTVNTTWKMLSSITVAVNTGSWTTVWSVAYEYYTTDTAGQGLTGDLRTITVTTPLSSGGNDVRTTYFRYYTTPDENPDLRHLIKCRVDPEAIRRGLAQSTPVDVMALNDTDIKAYAALYFEYDDYGHVTSLLTGGGCGCGGSSGLYEFEIDWRAVTDAYAGDGSVAPGDWGANRWRSRTTVTQPDGTRRALYFDEMGWLLATVQSGGATFDPETDALWITKYARDGRGRPTAEFTPAAVDWGSYVHSTGTILTRPSAGLVRVTEYSASPYLPFAVTARKVKEGASGTAITLEEIAYLDPSSAANARTFGSTNPAKLARSLPSSRTIHRDGSTTDVTSFSYTFYSGAGSWAPKKQTVTLPSLAGGDSSGPSSVTTEVYFDAQSRPVLRKDGAGAFSYTRYGTNGLVVEQVADVTSAHSNANTAAGTTGASLPGSGLQYVTAYAHDNQGRVSSITLPSGRVAGNYYTKLADGRVVTLTAPSMSGGNATGPVDYSVHNLAGKSEAEGTLALASATAISGLINASSGTEITAVQSSTLARLTTHVYDTRGVRRDTTRLYTTIASAYDQTSYTYDEIGRVVRVVDPTGTITTLTHDARGRVVERWEGTDASGSGNMVKIESTEFDFGSVGNGLVTARTLHASASSGDDRVTEFTYNYRGHLMAQENPEAPHFAFKRDRLGRTLATGGYSSAPGAVDPTSTTTGRVSLNEIAYSSRGMARLATRHKINQSSGAGEDTLTQANWYDGAGRVIKSRGESLTKTAYDALGRATRTFVLAADNDSTHAHATDVTGDTVVEEHQRLYDNSAKTGNLLMSVEIARHPLDTSTTGALDGVSDSVDVVAVGSGSFKGRAQITSYYYDGLDRMTDAVSLGTNGGSTYTRSSDTGAGSRSSTRLITSTAFNTDGTVLSTTDPRGIITRQEYDGAGRTTKTIANYTDGTPGGGTYGDQDQVTQYGYADGLLTTLTAKMPSSGDDQTTTYTYGVSSGGTLPSGLTSNRRLRQVQYPDSAGGSDVVRYAYNRQGQPIGVLDQAGNQIDTAYDDAGREVSRAVSTLISGFDGSVRRIEMAYLSRGAISTVTQYDAATSGNVTDQVRYEYDGWGNLERFRQDVDSTMDGAGDSTAGREAFEVLYTLAKNAPSGGVNTVRRTGMTSKADGTAFHTVGYTYGSGSSLSDLLSRVATVTVGSGPTTVATYDYLGGGHLVGTSLNQAELNTSVFTESGGTHTYGDLDQFNRPTRWNWERPGGAVGGFYNVAIAYDENSNPTSTVDDVHVRVGNGKHLFDVVYTLDALNRVIGADEGNKSGSSIESGYRTRNELWNSLSLTGNWKNRKLDANGDGDFGDEEDRDEPLADQTFTKANEWTDRKIAKASGGGADHDTYDYTHDAVGNLTVEDRSGLRGAMSTLGRRGFVYDAFGRMVTATGIIGEDGPVVTARHRYNGLGFRIMWQYDADTDGTLEDAERYYQMHDERWRVIAVFRNQDAAPKEGYVHHAAGSGGYGASSYIDSVILRDRDANGGGGWTGASDGTLEERRYYCQNWRADVVAITTSEGFPLEYIRYSSYGEPTVYPVSDINMDGVVNTTDLTEWALLQGGASTNAAYATSDINFDGSEDSLDGDLFYFDSYLPNSGLSGKGKLSSPAVGNRIGYAGYAWDPSIKAYHVRHRVLLPEIGRWSRRDPIGYVDGMSLYEYAIGSPVTFVDETGLIVTSIDAAFRQCMKLPTITMRIECLETLANALGVGNETRKRLLELMIKRMRERAFEEGKRQLKKQIAEDGKCRYLYLSYKVACEAASACGSCKGIDCNAPGSLARASTCALAHEGCSTGRLAHMGKCDRYMSPQSKTNHVQAINDSQRAATNCFTKAAECGGDRACAD